MSMTFFKSMTKLNCPHRYDIIFHLSPLWKPAYDGVRPKEHFSDTWRDEADLMLQFIFKLFPPKYFISLKADTLDARIDECFQHVDKLL